MLKILLASIAIMAFSWQPQAFDGCQKQQVKDSVLKICKLIEAKGKSALYEVAKYRYCGSTSVWIQDSNVKMVLHPVNGHLNNKSLRKNTDENGESLFIEFDKIANKNKRGGWIDFLWTKPGTKKPTTKTFFIKKCGGDLKWIAGSGVWK